MWGTCVVERQVEGLLKRDLRRSLFSLFSSWAGSLGLSRTTEPTAPSHAEHQFASLQAMAAVLCCGPCFDPQALTEDGHLYPWLDHLLSASEPKVCFISRIILFICFFFGS